MVRTESGRVAKIERFSNYVARHLGFEDANHECPQLSKLVDEYMKNSKETEGSIYEYFDKAEQQQQQQEEETAESLYVKLLEELDRCILSYFAYHWTQAPNIISQVLNVDSEQKKWKNLVMAATRKQRFAKVTKELKITRMFSTLVDEMKAIGESNCTEVMVPVAHSQRSPVLLFMGGGMGAGKSTVLKDIKNEPFWSGAAGNAVMVEADAFKETDVIYQALNSKGHHQDMLSTSELVHQSSTNAASSLLVTALNEGRDVIMDGTLSWEPFVQQTIAMVRNVHKCRYHMGVGYEVKQDGTIIENYWEAEEENKEEPMRKPYRIELVGVICDAYLAVVRGIRRAIHTGRAVRVKSQLKSHKRFASAFPIYCELVDNARLYCTNGMGVPPRLIAWKDVGSRLLVDPEEIKCLNLLTTMNDEADSIDELFQEPNPLMDSGSVWKDIVMLPSRDSVQLNLKLAIMNIEKIKH
ncbi:calmodulin calcium-dependent NAD kinase-like [Impatiens glandulifera]|uniref:calmodulin calcium-dependent NAD kinase-like n=1 Tax=Impatiens glandulifera TaxID=253017 RepID=UPI001FB04F05|nr:calmodulin calcium-dependent NAD kinase-like [Impatiens glandulifera]